MYRQMAACLFLFLAKVASICKGVHDSIFLHLQYFASFIVTADMF